MCHRSIRRRYKCRVANGAVVDFHGELTQLGGWVPAYVSSLRHYADHGVTIAFQINTDAGVMDDSSDLVPALEAALADLTIKTLP